MIDVDVAIVGAGPAGAAAASMLAPHRRVLLIDRRSHPTPRVGESLIPAARRVLRDMHLLSAFESEGHAPYLGNRFAWGSRDVQEADFLRDPDGPGWHLDRPAFERFLREAAQHRGTRLLTPARLRTVTRQGNGWRLSLRHDAGPQEVYARMLVDAGGRNAPLATRLGALRRPTDGLVACWAHGVVATEHPSTAGFSSIESTPHGWWYTAPLPERGGRARRVLVFHTDGDLDRDRQRLRTGEDLRAAARGAPSIDTLLHATGWACRGPLHRSAAHTAHLSRCTGQGWLAIGDAALSFDPLSSRGLFHALYTGMLGAHACRRSLSGEHDALPRYAAALERIRATYRWQLERVYRAEPRWRDHPFWARRIGDVRVGSCATCSAHARSANSTYSSARRSPT